jgi:beta-glucosidase/6-phospho-beta-glucosidase/beta-galactosidase
MPSKDLMFGVGTSDHQCEAYREGCDDSWDVWEREQCLVPRGRATDFWNRYEEDIRLARDLGCGAFRFSVSWTRVQPARDMFSEEALEHYDALTGAIVDAGMEPIVTLLHGALPPYVDMTADDFPDLFAAYAARVAARLAPRVRWWLTLNEPDQFVYGYIKPWWAGEYRLPPGLPRGAAAREPMRYVAPLMRNLFRANARARQEIRKVRADARVSANPFLLGLPGWLQAFLDWRARSLRSERGWHRAVRRAARHRLPGRGRLDLILAAFSASRERGRQVEFSRPYEVAPLRLLAPAGGPVAQAGDDRAALLAALRGASVIVVSGTTAVAGATSYLPNASVRPVVGYREAVAELAGGRAAALLGDEAILAPLAAEEPGRWVVPRQAFGQERYVAAASKADTGLLKVVDQVLTAKPAAPPPGPASRGLERVRRRRRLLVGVRQDLPGPEGRTLGAEGRATEERLARDVAARVLGDADRVTFEQVPLRQRLPALRAWWSRPLNWLLHPIDWLLCAVNSNWWHLGLKGDLPEWLCPPECVGQQDFVGLDYYWGIPSVAPRRLRELLHLTTGDYANAPVWPAAMSRVLRRAAQAFPGQEIMLVENGCVDVASNMPRATYLREHVREARAVAADGVPLVGYIFWSVTSNREWGLAFGPGNDFGLFRVDLDGDPTLRRCPTPAAIELRNLIRAGGSGPG